MKRFDTACTQLQYGGPDTIFSASTPKSGATSDKNLEDHAPHCLSSSGHSHQNDFKISVDELWGARRKVGLVFQFNVVDQNDKSVNDFEAAPTQLRPSALALSFSQEAPA